VLVVLAVSVCKVYLAIYLVWKSSATLCPMTLVTMSRFPWFHCGVMSRAWHQRYHGTSLPRQRFCAVCLRHGCSNIKVTERYMPKPLCMPC
jgi:hypothetical protein